MYVLIVCRVPYFVYNVKVLDTRDLTVHSVKEQGSDKELAFQFEKDHPALGTALTIQNPSCSWKK